MKRIQLAFLTALAVSFGAPVVFSGISAQDLPDGVTEAMIEQGRAIFAGAGLCAACHGQDATGLVGPDLTDDEWLDGSGRYPEIVERTRAGVSAEEAKNTMGAIMPARGGAGITDEQVEAVAAYVWSLRRRSRR